LTSVCTGSWVYGRMGLLDGLLATNRKEADRLEAAGFGKLPLDRLAEIAPACRISRARVVDAGRICDWWRYRIRVGGRISPAAARRLRRGVRFRGGSGDGVPACVRSVSRRRGVRHGGGARWRLTTMTVAAIWRYPVKSMAGERLSRAEITSAGLAGDRVVQVYDRRGRIVTARTYPRLLRLRATLRSDG
jgi:hypothetical protein